MDKQKRELVIVGVLSVILVLVVTNIFGKQRNQKSLVDPVQKAKQAVQEEAVPSGTEEGAGKMGVKKPVIKEPIYWGREFRDPMSIPQAFIARLPKPVVPEEIEPKVPRSEGEAEQTQEGAGHVDGQFPVMDLASVSQPLVVKPPVLVIRGIIWGVDPAQVIIEDKIVSVGDRIGDVLITAVDDEGVHVEYQGWDFVLGVRAGVQSVQTDNQSLPF